MKEVFKWIANNVWLLVAAFVIIKVVYKRITEYLNKEQRELEEQRKKLGITDPTPGT